MKGNTVTLKRSAVLQHSKSYLGTKILFYHITNFVFVADLL